MPRDDRAIKLATFNICHGSDGKGTPVDLDRLVAGCRELDADVLALQEVDRGVRRSGRVDQAAVIADRLGYRCVYGPALRVGGGTMGNALLVRGSVTDVDLIPMSGHLRLGRRDRRAVLLASAIVDGAVLSVAVTHLSTAVLDNVPQQDRALDALD